MSKLSNKVYVLMGLDDDYRAFLVFISDTIDNARDTITRMYDENLPKVTRLYELQRKRRGNERRANTKFNRYIKSTEARRQYLLHSGVEGDIIKALHLGHEMGAVEAEHNKCNDYLPEDEYNEFDRLSNQLYTILDVFGSNAFRPDAKRSEIIKEVFDRVKEYELNTLI